MSAPAQPSLAPSLTMNDCYLIICKLLQMSCRQWSMTMSWHWLWLLQLIIYWNSKGDPFSHWPPVVKRNNGFCFASRWLDTIMMKWFIGEKSQIEGRFCRAVEAIRMHSFRLSDFAPVSLMELKEEQCQCGHKLTHFDKIPRISSLHLASSLYPAISFRKGENNPFTKNL